MKTNVESLKALYVKLGGNLTDYYSDIAGGIPVSEYDLISDCIQAVSKKASSGGGSDLPAVTTDDNGDVLTVVEGAWAKADAPSGLPEAGADGNVLTADNGEWVSAAPKSDVYDVNLTKYGDDYTATHDGVVVGGADIISAYNDGKNVVLKYNVDGVETVGNVYKCEDDTIAFTCFGGGEEDFYLAYIACLLDEEDGDFWVDFSSNLPYSSIAADGKLLCVDHGAYELVDPTDLSNAPLIVHGTISHGDFSFTDTTVKDVYDAKVADRAVFLDDGDGYRWDLTGALYDSNSSTYSIAFGCLKHGATKIVAAIIGISGTADTTTGGSVIESDLTPNT